MGLGQFKVLKYFPGEKFILETDHRAIHYWNRMKVEGFSAAKILYAPVAMHIWISTNSLVMKCASMFIEDIFFLNSAIVPLS